jgi:hypothetical protein
MALFASWLENSRREKPDLLDMIFCVILWPEFLILET